MISLKQLIAQYQAGEMAKADFGSKKKGL